MLWSARFTIQVLSCAALLAVNFPHAAGAQQTPITPRRILTLADALDLAERYNPHLEISAARVAEADAAVVSASAYSNPEITFGSLGRQRAIQIGTLPGTLHGFTVTQQVELPSVRRTRIAASRLSREASQYSLAGNRLAVRAMVKQTFFEALRRREEIKLTQENLQLLEDLLRRIEVQVEVGEAPMLELTRAQAEVASAAIQAQSAEMRYSTALAALHAAIGGPIGDIEPQDKLDPMTIVPPLDELVSQVLAKHPNIAEADAGTRRANAILENERAQKMPQPRVWADVLEQPDVAQYRFGVSLTLPIWNRREGPIAEAVAAQRRANAIADARRLEITAALERVYGQYRVAQNQLQMFEAGTIRQAEAAVRGAEAAFRFGERGILEVLDAQRVLRSARQEYLNAQFDRQQALIELEQLGAVDLKSGQP